MIDARRFVENLEEAARTHRLEELTTRLRQIDGCDRTAAVHCVVDDAGRFLDVHLASSWRDVLDAGSLGPAILEALEFAQSKAGMVPLVLRRHGIVHRPESVPRAVDEPTPPPGSADFHDVVAAKQRAVWQTMDDVAARLADLTGERQTASPNGLFRATVRAGRVVRLHAELRIESADIDLILDEARAVLRCPGVNGG